MKKGALGIIGDPTLPLKTCNSMPWEWPSNKPLQFSLCREKWLEQGREQSCVASHLSDQFLNTDYSSRDHIYKTETDTNSIIQIVNNMKKGLRTHHKKEDVDNKINWILKCRSSMQKGKLVQHVTLRDNVMTCSWSIQIFKHKPENDH